MAPTIPLLPITLLTLAFTHISASPLPQNGDGGGSGALPDGGLGYDPTSAGNDSPGADGTDTGGVGLSKGAIIGIAVVAGLVIIVGSKSFSSSPSTDPKHQKYPNPLFPTVTTAVLFWGAKKRQWAVAATMRRSVRRVTTGLKEAMTPRTPHKMTFSPIVEKRRPRRGGSFGDGLLAGSKDHNNGQGQQGSWQGEEGMAGPARGNLEKGQAAERVVRDESADGGQGQGRKKQRPSPARVQVPESKFEMDSPKTPMWNKVFGR